MIHTVIDLIKEFAVHITFILYLIIGFKISKSNTKICKDDGVDLIPPSTQLGIILFWLFDLIYVQFIYKEE